MLYDEPKRLVRLGLATARSEPAGRRTRTAYAITDEGGRALGAWLATQPGPPRFEFETMLRLVELLGVIHALTDGWPQRPGFASSRQLLTSDRGGDVHLDAMPPHAVEAIRGAWEPILQGPECAIHADVGAGNILVNGDAVALLDWDEARVDVPWFDYASLPIQVQAPSPTDRERLITAGVAWEAATCWVVEPAYAARCLAELFQRLGHPPNA